MKLNNYKIGDRLLIKSKGTKIEKIVALKDNKKTLINIPKGVF